MLHGAYASFEENEKASIKSGKLADLVVLGPGPLSESPSSLVPIERTGVGGRCVGSITPMLKLFTQARATPAPSCAKCTRVCADRAFAALAARRSWLQPASYVSALVYPLAPFMPKAAENKLGLRSGA